jgi:carbon-monoxide dehydrogenase large subunit
MAVGGPAIYMSVQKVKDKLKRIGAHMVEASPDDMVYEDARIFVRGFSEKAVTFQEAVEAVSAAYKALSLPQGVEPGVTETSFFDPPNFTFPFGTHIVVAEVDPPTGEVKLLRYIAVDDCGRVINPMIVDGQIQGGIAQGVGQALLEGAMYDEYGQMVTGSFMDYPVPTSTEIPMIEMEYTETLTQVNPIGAKGIGEAGTIAAAPAVVNAVVDALAPLGVRHIDMPLWPQTVWRSVEDARS